MSKYRLLRGSNELVAVNAHRDIRVESIHYKVRDNQAEPIAVAGSLHDAVAAMVAPERIIKWDERASKRYGWGYVPVWIDVWKLDALLPLASNMGHVRFAGENGIRGKYAGVDQFVRRARRTPIIMPPAQIEHVCKEHPDRDIVYLFNGRHRFAWMRDHGAKALPVAVLESEASQVAELVGTDARVCRVTMLEIPEWKPPLMEQLAA
jgi:hypothetical protein